MLRRSLTASMKDLEEDMLEEEVEKALLAVGVKEKELELELVVGGECSPDGARRALL
jgi:hypothetical protein